MLVVNSGKGDFRLVVGEVVEDMGEWTWYCVPWCFAFQKPLRYSTCLLYTSDAADEDSSV